MSQEENCINIKYGNPSAIGIFGLAVITLIGAFQKLGFTGSSTSLIIPWAIFLGGIAQLYAGIIDMKTGNTFGGTAFLGFGLFWLGIASGWLIQNGVFNETMLTSADTHHITFVYISYFIFSLIMTIGSLLTNKVLFIIFVFIDLLFIGFILASFNISPKFAKYLTAYSELFISLFSFYSLACHIINGMFKKEILPVGSQIVKIKE